MNQSKSLTKGLSVLKEVMLSDKPLTANILCQKLDIDKSTMSRLVTTLMQENFIEYLNNSKEIILSDLMRKLTQKDNREKIVQNTQELLDKIFYMTNECSYIGILDNNSVLYLNQVDKSKRVLKTRDSIGKHAPLHTNGFGKIILSYCDIDLSQLQLTKYTSNTITSISRLQKEIEIVKQTGYAIGNEEHEFGLKSLGVAYLNKKKEFVGAVGISGLSVRLDEHTLKKFGEEIFKLLNYS
ncbi:IclR family transcriptional regulator [Sulfurospirillum arcachonense]|uniref:IclR family transcriptional regulator n=1 Tax=Sulfurospirillum arcachonense TaxID=57666 RepID=UPI000469982D|nr:IclR family transcriptional regulator [Sulfurospirillum arcachonense]